MGWSNPHASCEYHLGWVMTYVLDRMESCTFYSSSAVSALHLDRSSFPELTGLRQYAYRRLPAFPDERVGSKTGFPVL